MRFRRLVEEHLADRFHVRALDLRGHGRSGWEEPWTIDQHVEDVLETVTEPATWIGHSFGGRLTAEITARRPELVERAVLLDPALWVPPDDAESAARHELSKAPLGVRGGGAGARGPRPSSTRRGSSSRRRCASTSSSSPTAAGSTATHGRPSPTPTARWRRSRRPGTRCGCRRSSSSPTTPSSSARPSSCTTADALGDLLEVAAVPGGHIVLWDAYEETAAAIAAFLA